MTSSIHFGGVFTIQRFTQNGRQVKDDNEENRILTRYLQKHTGIPGITEQPNGWPTRGHGDFVGAWKWLDGDTYVFTNDIHGDHLDQAQQAHEECQMRAENADMMGYQDGVDEAYFQLMDDMEELSSESIPVELEETTMGGKPQFHLNVATQGKKGPDLHAGDLFWSPFEDMSDFQMK